jgi:hypothetical protein
VIDSTNGKLLVVANSGGPGLFRCNLDGTGCSFTNISAGQVGDTGNYPSAVIDSVNGKLLAATTNRVNASGAPALFRCNLDGTGCTYTDISAGRADGGWRPSAVIDSANGKLLVVGQDETLALSAAAPALFRCNLDGTGCTYVDISVGQLGAVGYHLAIRDRHGNSGRTGA